MKRLLLCGVLGLATTAPCFAAGTNLWDEVLDVVTARIKRDGPDYDAGQFISMAHGHAWERRMEIVKLVAPFLTNETPDKVAGAIDILQRYRGYHPGTYIGNFESNNAAFFADLDSQVYEHIAHFRGLKSDRVDRALALYLGISPSPQAKRQLLEIVRSPSGAGAKEQALICLTWHRDPIDMETLLPFMLEDSQAARSLPYLFRNSYGQPARPYLRRAAKEAKTEDTRRAAEKELELLEHH